MCWSKAIEEPDFISDLQKQKYLIDCSELWNSPYRGKKRMHLVIKHHTVMHVPGGRAKVPLWHVLSLWESLTLYSRSGVSRQILTNPSARCKQGQWWSLSHTSLAQLWIVEIQVHLRMLQLCRSSPVLMQCSGEAQCSLPSILASTDTPKCGQTQPLLLLPLSANAPCLNTTMIKFIRCVTVLIILIRMNLASLPKVISFHKMWLTLM